MVKSNMYAEKNVLLSSLMTKSRLACTLYCVKLNSCDMMIIKQINNDKSSNLYLCEKYEIINYYNLSSKDLFPYEVWYKQEILLKIMERKDGFEMTTFAPCPYAFTQIAGGCYYIDHAFSGDWNQAYTECVLLGGALAQFQSVGVSNILRLHCRGNPLAGM